VKVRGRPGGGGTGRSGAAGSGPAGGGGGAARGWVAEGCRCGGSARAHTPWCMMVKVQRGSSGRRYWCHTPPACTHAQCRSAAAHGAAPAPAPPAAAGGGQQAAARATRSSAWGPRGRILGLGDAGGATTDLFVAERGLGRVAGMYNVSDVRIQLLICRPFGTGAPFRRVDLVMVTRDACSAARGAAAPGPGGKGCAHRPQPARPAGRPRQRPACRAAASPRAFRARRRTGQRGRAPRPVPARRGPPARPPRPRMGAARPCGRIAGRGGGRGRRQRPRQEKGAAAAGAHAVGRPAGGRRGRRGRAAAAQGGRTQGVVIISRARPPARRESPAAPSISGRETPRQPPLPLRGPRGAARRRPPPTMAFAMGAGRRVACGPCRRAVAAPSRRPPARGRVVVRAEAPQEIGADAYCCLVRVRRRRRRLRAAQGQRGRGRGAPHPPRSACTRIARRAVPHAVRQRAAPAAAAGLAWDRGRAGSASTASAPTPAAPPLNPCATPTPAPLYRPGPGPLLP
jgi:hypothetical protein